jgi:hypothetical protein
MAYYISKLVQSNKMLEFNGLAITFTKNFIFISKSIISIFIIDIAYDAYLLLNKLLTTLSIHFAVVWAVTPRLPTPDYGLGE